MFQPQLNAIFAFILTGIILTVLTFTATVKLAAFEDDHPALFTVTKSADLNKLIMHGITIVVMALLIIFNYIVVLYYLYLLLYHLFNYLDTINLYLSLMVDIATIVGLLVGLLKLLKEFDFKRNIQYLYSLLAGR